MQHFFFFMISKKADLHPIMLNTEHLTFKMSLKWDGSVLLADPWGTGTLKCFLSAMVRG